MSEPLAWLLPPTCLHGSSHQERERHLASQNLLSGKPTHIQELTLCGEREGEREREGGGGGGGREREGEGGEERHGISKNACMNTQFHTYRQRR